MVWISLVHENVSRDPTWMDGWKCASFSSSCKKSLCYLPPLYTRPRCIIQASHFSSTISTALLLFSWRRIQFIVRLGVGLFLLSVQWQVSNFCSPSRVRNEKFKWIKTVLEAGCFASTPQKQDSGRPGWAAVGFSPFSLALHNHSPVRCYSVVRVTAGWMSCFTLTFKPAETRVTRFKPDGVFIPYILFKLYDFDHVDKSLKENLHECIDCKYYMGCFTWLDKIQ